GHIDIFAGAQVLQVDVLLPEISRNAEEGEQGALGVRRDQHQADSGIAAAYSKIRLHALLRELLTVKIAVFVAAHAAGIASPPAEQPHSQHRVRAGAARFGVDDVGIDPGDNSALLLLLYQHHAALDDSQLIQNIVRHLRLNVVERVAHAEHVE